MRAPLPQRLSWPRSGQESRSAKVWPGLAFPLKVGVTPVTAANLVPQALGRLHREKPNISVSVLEGVLDETQTFQ